MMQPFQNSQLLNLPKLLMYHRLAVPGYRPSAMFARFVLGTDLFEEQLVWLKTNGYSSATLAALLRNPRLPKKTVILTFDDALANFELAMPLLKHYGFSATLFVPTAFVGKRSSWLPGTDGQHLMLSWQALGDLAKEGIDIAAHGHAHLQLDNVPLAVARKDIERGKGMLEHYLGQAVHSFAYPYGYYHQPVQQLVKQAGFAAACAVDKRLGYSPNTDAFALPRITVAGGMTARAVAQVMSRRDTVLTEAGISIKAELWRTARRWQRSKQPSKVSVLTRLESRQ